MSLIAHYLLHDGFEGLNQCDLGNPVQLNPDNSGTFPGSLYSGLNSERVFDITEDFSWFIAFKRNSAADAQLIDMRTSGSYGYQPLHMYSNGDIQFYVGIGSSGTGSEFSTGSHITINKWHYITLVKRSDRISCYVDGKFIGENINQHAIKLHNLPLYIGRRHDLNGSTAYSLNGMISDVRLYDHALSEEEIKKLSSDLVCHYTFDTFHGLNGNVADSSKSSLHGTSPVTGISGADSSIGAYGERIIQEDRSYVKVHPAARLLPPFTYSIWARITMYGTSTSSSKQYWDRFYYERMRIWSCTDSGGFNIEEAPSSKKSCSFAIYDGGYSHNIVVSEQDYERLLLNNPDGWHLFTMTVDSSEIYRAYIDGELVGESTLNPGQFSYNDSAAFFLGAEPIGHTPSNYFDGSLDDFRVYRKALSNDEIKDLMHLRASVYSNGIMEVPYYNNLNSDPIELADNNDIQLSKKGVLSNIDLIEQEYKIINGKKFLKIVEHDVRYIQEYFNPDHSEDLFSCGPNRFSMLGILEDFWSTDNSELEFLLTYPDEAHTYTTEFSDNEYRELPFKVDWNSDWSISFSIADIKRPPFKIMLDTNTAVKLDIIESIPSYGISGGYLLACGDKNCVDKNQSTSSVRNDIPLTNSTVRTVVLSFNSTTGILKLESDGRSSEWDVTKSPNSPTALSRDSISGLYPFNPCSVYIGGNPQARLDYSSNCHYNLWRQNWSPLDSIIHPELCKYTPLQIDYTTQWGSPDASGIPGLGLNDAREWSLLDCEPLHPYWYGGLIQYQPYSENGIVGFPAADGGIHKWVQLWVRVDNTEFKAEPILENNVLFIKSLMED